jgi:RHS repeat-associated protein
VIALKSRVWDHAVGTIRTPPNAPIIGTASGGIARATVNFSASPPNTGPDITGYTVTSSPAGGVDTNAGTTGLSHVVTGLTNGTAYTFTVKASNAAGTSVASAVSNSLIPSAPPTVNLTNPATNAISIAPGSFTLTATASSPNSTVAKMDFYAGTTLLGTVTAAPYTFNWSNIVAGSYSLTAVATDAWGDTTTSAPVAVTVSTGGAQAYYIHTDQLDTPRVITDGAGNVTWQWDNSDPFGNNVPNENPGGAGQFVFPLRFAGQYADKETGLHYNINRDYDPAIGRYIQSDPIGLAGGINGYTYVDGNPVNFVDPDGLYKFAPGAKGPFTQGMDSSLQCFEKCAGAEVTVTSGVRDGNKGPHGSGNACDLGRKANPELDRQTAESCFASCFAPRQTYGQEESNNPGIGGTHFHLQNQPGRGGASGFPAGIKPYQP